jgi:hypothetical protein
VGAATARFYLVEELTEELGETEKSACDSSA